MGRKLTPEQIQEIAALSAQFNKPEMGVGERVADAAKSAASGLGRGVAAIPGAVGDAAKLIEAGVNWGDQKLSGRTDQQQADHEQLRRENSVVGDVPNPFDAITTDAIASHVPGLDYQPKTALGEGLQTVGEFLPGAVVPGQVAVRGGTAAQRVTRGAADAAKFAVAPGLASEGAGAVTEGTALEGPARAGAAIATALATGRLRDPAAATPVPGRDPGAVERINRAIDHDGGFDRILRELDEVGENATLADTGPNLRGQADAISSSPGAGQRTIVDTLRQRSEEAAARATTIADQVLGPYQNYAERTAELMKARKGRADQLYGAARASAARIDTAPVVASIEGRLPNSLAAGAVEPTGLERTLLGVRDQLRNRSDIDSLHSLKTSLDDQIGAAFRGGSNAEASQLIDIRDQLLDAMDAGTMQNGASLYGTARREFAGDSAILAAREEGLSLFQRGTRPDELALRLRKMTEAEREGLKEGARDAVHSIMGNATNDAQSVVTEFKRGFNRQKLAMVVGEREADAMLRTLNGEARKQGTYTRIQGNSSTAGRQAAQEELPQGVTSTPASQAPTPGQLLVSAAQKGYGAVRNTFANDRGNRIREDMASMLSTYGPDQTLMLRQLREAFQQRQRFNPRGYQPLIAGSTSQVDPGTDAVRLQHAPGGRN